MYEEVGLEFFDKFSNQIPTPKKSFLQIFASEMLRKQKYPSNNSKRASPSSKADGKKKYTKWKYIKNVTANLSNIKAE